MREKNFINRNLKAQDEMIAMQVNGYIFYLSMIVKSLAQVEFIPDELFLSTLQ